MRPALDLQQVVARVVSAYVGANKTAPETFSVSLSPVHATFTKIITDNAREAATLKPAVPRKKSVF